MLVMRRGNDTLRLIHQREHARLAGELAQHWHRPRAIGETMWPRVIEAVRAHDQGWAEAERAPMLDERGRPHSFKTLPIARHIDIWRRSVTQALEDDAYVGLLIALHARWLYTTLMRPTDRASEAAAQAFTDELDQRVDAVLRTMARGSDAERAAAAPHALLAARRLIGALDGLSLMLCGALPFGAFPERLRFGDRCEKVTFGETADGAAVTPWPFDAEAVTVSVTAHDVADRAYADSGALNEAMRESEAVTVRFVVRAGVA